MKKWLGLCLAVVLALSAFSFIGCGSGNVEYEIMSVELESEQYAIGFKKGNVALKDKVEEILVGLKKDGTLNTISTKWFGSDKSLISKDYVAGAGATDASFTNLIEANEFKLGFDPAFPPMGYKNEKGEYVGFDLDIATAVCEKLNVKLKLVPINWDNKEIDLEVGNIDCIWNGFTVNDSRLESMTMSVPYLNNAQVVVIKKGAYTSLEQLKGKKIGVQTGSSAVDAVANNDNLKDNPLVKNESNVALIQLELKNGNVDAVVLDKVVAEYYLTEIIK